MVKDQNLENCTVVSPIPDFVFSCWFWCTAVEEKSLRILNCFSCKFSLQSPFVTSHSTQFFLYNIEFPQTAGHETLIWLPYSCALGVQKCAKSGPWFIRSNSDIRSANGRRIDCAFPRNACPWRRLKWRRAFEVLDVGEADSRYYSGRTRCSFRSCHTSLKRSMNDKDISDMTARFHSEHRRWQILLIQII